jgi:hypothetical protein
MIDAAAIRDIIATYNKHGWALRRVLLSEDIADARERFGEVEVERSDIDAMWFVRSSRPGATAWELRHLSTTPIAFLTVIEDAGMDADDRIADTEERLRQAISRRK